VSAVQSLNDWGAAVFICQVVPGCDKNNYCALSKLAGRWSPKLFDNGWLIDRRRIAPARLYASPARENHRSAFPSEIKQGPYVDNADNARFESTLPAVLNFGPKGPEENFARYV
jgi:hypothetical protein